MTSLFGEAQNSGVEQLEPGLGCEKTHLAHVPEKHALANARVDAAFQKWPAPAKAGDMRQRKNVERVPFHSNGTRPSHLALEGLQSDNSRARTYRGLLPVQRLNAWVKALTS